MYKACTWGWLHIEFLVRNFLSNATHRTTQLCPETILHIEEINVVSTDFSTSNVLHTNIKRDFNDEKA